jgi:hypothetical protein
MSEIAPALTPDQWERQNYNTDIITVSMARTWQGTGYSIALPECERDGEWPAVILTPEQCYGTAAILLHEQPFGFTREDVALLRKAAGGADAYTTDEWSRWDSLADRISALLPPE